MGYAISPASLRLDDLTPTILNLLRASGERTITIAPEVGSDRLRRVINKTITNEEILAAAEMIFESGFDNLKLYFMIGLPTETDEDLVSIRDMTLQLREIMLRHQRARGHIGRIVGGVNPLVPKPGTAYQWLPMEDDGSIERKIRSLVPIGVSSSTAHPRTANTGRIAGQPRRASMSPAAIASAMLASA